MKYRTSRHIFLGYSLLLCVLLALPTACQPDSLQELRPVLPDDISCNPDGTIGVPVRIEIPGPTAAATRALSANPNYDELKLYVLVFENGEGLRQVELLSGDEWQMHQPDKDHGHDELMTFTVNLEPTDKNAVIHLIATNQDISANIRYGTEDLVLSSLYTDEGNEAYWQRIDLHCNIPSAEQIAEKNEDGTSNEEDVVKAETIKAALRHVPLIRNFCRVSVFVVPDVTNFELTGLYVVNTVDRGSVAPYVRFGADADGDGRFVEYYYYDEAERTYAGKSYDDISEQGYIGTLPSGVQLINTGTDPQTIATKSEKNAPTDALQPVYFYERPARADATERTFVILRGNVTIDGKTQTGRFYKVDLGRIDETISGEGDTPGSNGGPIGLFSYYNLLRNFDYSIVLKEVSDAGYDSFEEASRGVVYNNFSAAVEARNMKSISDGQDMIFVNHTSYVFTYPDQIDTLLAQYRTGISDGKGGIERNDLLYYVVDKSGDDVIKGVDYSGYDHGPDLKKWNTYLVKGNDPTDLLRQQRMYVYRGNRAAAGQPADYGLYRVITYFSHTPWSFEHIDTFPGSWEQMDDMPSWDWSSEFREVGQSAGSPLTLFFELPGGLPQALFPLEFVIEADRQNIQNAYVGNAVVRSVPASASLFADNPTLGTPNPTPPTTPRVQYVKTVTWEDYYGSWSEELVGKGGSVVRCRFLTITDLAQDGIGGSESKSTTTLRVSNPYFDRKENGKWVYHQDGFERDTATSDPSPRFWDFNSPYWDQVLIGMNNPSARVSYTRNNNRTDELIFVEGSKGSLTAAVDDDGVRYIQASGANDLLTHKHTYSPDQLRVIRVEIASTDGSGNPKAPSIAFSGVNPANSGLTSPTEPKKVIEKDGFTTYVYEITVPAQVTELYLDIKPDGTPMRFYKINFYPRWDEYGVDDDEENG